MPSVPSPTFPGEGGGSEAAPGPSSHPLRPALLRGAEVALAPVAASSGLSDDRTLLFSESNTRFLLEVPAEQAKRLESLFAGLPLTEIGTVADHPRLRIRGADGQTVIEAPLDELKQSWQRPLAWE